MVEEKTADGYQPYRYDDPSANLWSAYLSKSEKYDRTMAQNWKGDMDAILIFAGLFSASVTAFIIESYKTLNPDPDTATVLLLAQISQQLGSMGANSTTGVDSILSSFGQQSLVPTTAALICNTLWFLSLGFSLLCALSAILVEQWTRHFLQGSHSKPAPQDRARLSAYLFQGIKKYRMAAIVEAIPLLLHISLFLFFAGLIAFLHPVNNAIQYLILGILVFCCLLYSIATVLPIFRLRSPYWTPLSTLFWWVLRKLHLLHRRDPDGNNVPIICSMQGARDLEAMDITPERDQRDLKAMCWTISALREDNEFEPFVEVIPSVVSGFDYSTKWLMDALMHHEDITIKLGYRIPMLLASCTTGLVDPFVAQKRATTCLKAIWSLTMLSLPKPAGSRPDLSRKHLKFREDTFDLLQNVKRTVPDPEVDGHILSASIVVARSLMDMQFDRATALEAELLSALETGRTNLTHRDLKSCFNTFSDKEFIKTSRHRTQSLEEQVLNTYKLTTPAPHVMLETIALHHMRMVSLATNTQFGLDIESIEQVLQSVKSLQNLLNQAGLNLALEYISNMLELDSPPHEAFNTIRRAFFRIHFKVTNFAKESQERLVAYLAEAIEKSPSGSTRVSESIISIMLSMTRVLSEPTLIIKAMDIIERYSRIAQEEKAAGARLTLQALQRALPDGFQIQPPKLDLFTSHMYADARPVRKPIKLTSRKSTLASTVSTLV